MFFIQTFSPKTVMSYFDIFADLGSLKLVQAEKALQKTKRIF